MTEYETFPRVLILCDEPINRVGGGGVTMGNLFRGWPVDRIAQVWAHHRFEIDTEICPIFLRLGSHALPGSKWIPTTVKRQRTLVTRLRGLLRPGVHLDYARVLAWAQAFRPDVIYSQPTAYPMYTWWLPRWLARDLGVPLVNHIMDDWPVGVELEWPPLYRELMRPVLNRQLSQLFDAGASNLVICQAMADAFGLKYGKSFSPFHNVVDLAEWTTPKVNYTLTEKTFRVVYLGALADNNQVHSLRDIAETVARMAERGSPISLTVHTGGIYLEYYRQYLDGLQAVSHGGMVERKDLCTCLAAADLLVIPVNFDSRSLAATRYSMPTKVPEYMASGTPVLVYAPPHAPSAEYALWEGWGIVVSQRDPHLLEEAISSLMNSEELRASLGSRGRELAIRNHDAQIVRHRFWSLLASVARGDWRET